MKLFKVICMIAVCSTLLNSALPGYADKHDSFLRINKTYVLYTDPIIPHADKWGNFWIGIQAITLLFGGQYRDMPNGEATVEWHNHLMCWVPNAHRITSDGKSITLTISAKRVGKSHRMVVPLIPFLSALDLQWRWDKQYRVLTVTTPDILSKGVAGDFAQGVAEFEGPPSEPAAPVRAFAGPPFPIVPVVPKTITQSGNQIKWTLYDANTTNYQMILNFLVSGPRGEEYVKSGIPYPASYSNPPTYYTIQAHHIFEYKFSTTDKPPYHYSGDPLRSPGGGKVTVINRPVASIIAWIVL